MKRRVKVSFLFSLMVFLVVVTVSCGSYVGLEASLAGTLTPLSASVKGTVTARAGQANQNEDLATAIAKATAEANIVYATETAVSNLNSPSRLATATAIAPVVAELPSYGIDPAQGYVSWLHPPVTIQLEGYQQTGYANDFPNITASNFVMAADITWNTFNSASGCGFMFRSNGNKNQPSQYVVLISRLSSGQMGFLAMADGKIANFHSFYPKDKDKSFSWFNDATNRLGVVARGDIIDMYTNDELVAEVDTTQPPSNAVAAPPKPELPAGANNSQVQDFNNQLNQMNGGVDILTGELSQAQKNYTTSNTVLTDGFLGFIGLSQSGSMTCKFQNAWLFNLVK